MTKCTTRRRRLVPSYFLRRSSVDKGMREWMMVKCPKCYNNGIMKLYFYLFPEKKREKHSSNVLCFVFMISS